MLTPKQQWVKDTGATTKDILTHATDMFCTVAEAPKGSTNDDDFNGRPAHYIEGNIGVTGTIAILLNDGNIALIDVFAAQHLGSRSWDIISSITVT